MDKCLSKQFGDLPPDAALPRHTHSLLGIGGLNLTHNGCVYGSLLIRYVAMIPVAMSANPSVAIKQHPQRGKQVQRFHQAHTFPRVDSSFNGIA
jgi:hypothetical protein